MNGERYTPEELTPPTDEQKKEFAEIVKLLTKGGTSAGRFETRRYELADRRDVILTTELKRGSGDRAETPVSKAIIRKEEGDVRELNIYSLFMDGRFEHKPIIESIADFKARFIDPLDNEDDDKLQREMLKEELADKQERAMGLRNTTQKDITEINALLTSMFEAKR